MNKREYSTRPGELMGERLFANRNRALRSEDNE